MTDYGEAIANLAIQVAGLRGSLALAEENLGARLDLLAEKLGEVTASPAKGPPAADWPKLTDEERETAAAALAEWLSAFLRRWYPGYLSGVGECVLSHPEGLIEMSNLLGEFRRIYSAKHPPLADALILHDRVFPNIIARLAVITRGCAPGMCPAQRSRHPEG